MNKSQNIPVRQKVEILAADDAKQLHLGWIVEERLGIGVVSPKLTWWRRLWLGIRKLFIKSKPIYYSDKK